MSQCQEDLQKVIAIQAAIRGFLVRQDLRRQLLAIFEQEKAELEYLQENGCEYEYEEEYVQSGFNTLASQEQSESKLNKGCKEENAQVKNEKKEQWMQFPKVIPVLTGSHLEKTQQGIQGQGDKSHIYSSSDHLSRKKDSSQHFKDDEDNNQKEIKNNTKQQGTKNIQTQRISDKSDREEKKVIKKKNSYEDEYGLGIHDTSEHYSEEFMHLHLATQSPEISSINDTFRFTQEGSKRPTKQDIPGGTNRDLPIPGTMKNLLRGTLVDIQQSGKSQYQLQQQQQVLTMGQQQQKKRSELVKVEDQRCDYDVSPSMRSSSNNSSKDIRFTKISRIGHKENSTDLEPEHIFFGEEDEEEEEEEQINMMLVTPSQFKATMSAIKEMQNNQLNYKNQGYQSKVKKQSAHEKNMKKIKKLVSQNQLLNEENRARYDQLSQFSLMSYSQTALSSVQGFQNHHHNESSKIYEQNEYNCCNVNRYGVMHQHHSNNRWFSYDSFVIAAMDIQRVIRGYLSRKRIEFSRIKSAILKIETEYIEFKQFRVKKMKECANQLEFSAMNIIKFVKDFEKGEKYLQAQFRKKNFHKKIQLSREKLSSVFVEFLFEGTSNEKLTTLNLQKKVLSLKAEIIKQQRAYQEDLLAMENKYDELKQLHKDTVSKYIEGIQKISKKKQKSSVNHTQNNNIEVPKNSQKKTFPQENHNSGENDGSPRDSRNAMQQEQLPTQDRKNSVQAVVHKGNSSPQTKQTAQIIRMTERQNGSPRNTQQHEKEQYLVERSKSPTRKREIENYYDKNDREQYHNRQDQYTENGYGFQQKRQDNCPNSSRESMNSQNYNNNNNCPLSQSDKQQVLLRFQVEAERDLQAFEDKIKNIQRKGSSLLCMEEKNNSTNNGQRKENVQRNIKKDCEFRYSSHKESIK